MTRSAKYFVHEGRALEVRYARVMTKCQIWIYENDRPLGLHSIISLRAAAETMADGGDLIGASMEAAQRDVENGAFSLAASQRVA